MEYKEMTNNDLALFQEWINKEKPVFYKDELIIPSNDANKILDFSKNGTLVAIVEDTELVISKNNKLNRFALFKMRMSL